MIAGRKRSSPAPPALLVRRSALSRDSALQKGGRGARKLLVTEIRPDKEREAASSSWDPRSDGELCPVQLMANAELAVFNQDASQDRHSHRRGTEIYWLIEGEMTIEVEGTLHELVAGDLIIVNAGAAHEVMRDGRFLCGVFTADCGGVRDKHLEPNPG